MIWKIFEFSFIIVQQVSLHSLIGPRRLVRCRQFCWLHHGLQVVLRNRLPFTFWTNRDSPGQFVAQIRYCSVDTELIDGNDCAKKHIDCRVVTTEMYRQFCFSFAFSNLLVHLHWTPGIRECPFFTEVDHIPSDAIPFSVRFVRVSSVPLLFRSRPKKKTTNVRARIFLHTLQLFWNSLNTSLRFLLSPYNVVVHYMKMILPVNCSGSHCISVIMFWISARICNIMNPGNLSTRPPSAPRRICEENVPRDGYGNTRLVPVRRDAMSDFASSLTWYSVGVVDGDRKVSMEAMVKLATSMHGEMRCRGFSSSLLGLVTARHTSRGAVAQYAEIHARRNVMSDFSSSLFGLSTARQTLRPHALQSSCLESKGGDVVLLPDVSTCWQMEW